MATMASEGGDDGPTFEILAEESATTTKNPDNFAASPTSKNAAVAAALSAKARGATLVASQSWGAAVAAYTDALISLPVERYLATTRGVLLTNRALCYQRLGHWQLCKDDCDDALKHDAQSAKAWFRRAQAHRKLNANDLALFDIKQMLKLEPKSREGKKLARAIVADHKSLRRKKKMMIEKKKKKKTESSALPRLPASKNKSPGLGNLYKDKLGADVSTHARLLERIRVAANTYSSRKDPSFSSSSSNVGAIERTFAALLQPEGFRARVYPGLKLPDGFDAPQSLQDLLNDARFDGALTKMMPDVVAQANTVINNVKQKAAKNGEFMDSATESALRPQILLEAFARQITKVIGQTSARFMAQTVQSLAPRASDSDERANWDQLDDCLFDGLNDPGRFFGVQDGFMGKEWIDAILEDVQRMASSGRLQVGDPDFAAREAVRDKASPVESRAHFFALIGQLECKEVYPALAELLEQLEALPFELNKKRALRRTRELGEEEEEVVFFAPPGEISCAVSHIPSGARRRACMDGRSRGEPNGREVSFMYVISSSITSTLSLRHRSSGTDSEEKNSDHKEDVVASDIAMFADRLISYRSLLVSNEITATTEDVFVVTFFASACGRNAKGSSPGTDYTDETEKEEC